MKKQKYSSFEEYEKAHDEISQDFETVYIIETDNIISADLTTKTKYSKTVLNRFFKELKEYNIMYGFYECLIEELKETGKIKYNGLYDIKNGCYSYSYALEKSSDDYYYIFLNVKKF